MSDPSYSPRGRREPTPGTTEGADFADSSSNTVKLATDSRWATLRSEHAETVAWAQFTEAQEDAIHNLEDALSGCGVVDF